MYSYSQAEVVTKYRQTILQYFASGDRRTKLIFDLENELYFQSIYQKL